MTGKMKKEDMTVSYYTDMFWHVDDWSFVCNMTGVKYLCSCEIHAVKSRRAKGTIPKIKFADRAL